MKSRSTMSRSQRIHRVQYASPHHQLYDEEGRSTSIPHHNNGQVRELDGIALIGAMYELFPEEHEDIHLQNGATSSGECSRLRPVTAGTGRVEPAALGGVQGMDFARGTNEIRHAVPAQPQSTRDTDWTMGLHADPRYADDETHTLFTRPDGSQVRLLGRSTVQYVRKDRVRREVELPESSGWMHLGWQLTNGNRTITFAFNGQPIDRWTSGKALFEMTEGDFIVGQAGELPGACGGSTTSYPAHGVNREVLCNHAGGTTLRVHSGPGDCERKPRLGTSRTGHHVRDGGYAIRVLPRLDHRLRRPSRESTCQHGRRA